MITTATISRRSIGVILSVAALLTGCVQSVSPATTPTPELAGGKNALFIPPILRDDDPSPMSSSLTLIARESNKEFLHGKTTRTYGYVDVPIGIAYDAAAERLLVTGKLRPWLFEIRLIPI